MTRGRHFGDLFGTYLMSGAGAIPAQLLPYLIGIAQVDRGADLRSLGYAASALFAGQAVASLALPVLRPRGVARGEVLAAALLIAVFPVIAARAEPLAVQGAWFVLGIIAGVFQYVGMISAARSARPPASFLHRASVSMGISGTVIAVCSLVQVGTLETAAWLMAALQCGLALCAVALYRPAPEGGDTGRGASGDRTVPAPAPAVAARVTVVCIAAYFGSLIPFLSFMPNLFLPAATVSGLGVSLGVSRIAAAGLIAGMGMRLIRSDSRLIFAAAPAAFSAAIAAYHWHFIPGAAVMFFASEFLLNIIAPKFLGQAAIEIGGAAKWFYMIVLISAAVGQVATAGLLAMHAETAVAVQSCLAAFIPLVWSLVIARIPALAGPRRVRV
jgi:hypothetical protein